MVALLMPSSATARLKALGIMAGVVCLTSPDLVFDSLQRRNLLNQEPWRLDSTSSTASFHDTPSHLGTIQDAHPHTLSFLAGARGDRTVSLGVKDFGQSSNLQDAYRINGIDEASIVNATLNLDR